MVYNLTVKGQLKGLNELLDARTYNPKIKKYVNSVKTSNDEKCGKAIAIQLRGLHITKPIVIHYKFFVGDHKHDYSNVASAFIKSFEDALQQKKVISNDNPTFLKGYTTDFALDRNNPRTLVAIEELEPNQVVPDTYDWSDFNG